MTFDEIKDKIFLSYDRLYWLLDHADKNDEQWRYVLVNEIAVLRERLKMLEEYLK